MSAPNPSSNFDRESFTQIRARLIDLLLAISQASTPATGTSMIASSASAPLTTIDPQEIPRLVQSLQASLLAAQSQLAALPGLNLSPETQRLIADALQKNLTQQRELRQVATQLPVWNRFANRDTDTGMEAAD